MPGPLVTVAKARSSKSTRAEHSEVKHAATRCYAPLKVNGGAMALGHPLGGAAADAQSFTDLNRQ